MNVLYDKTVMRKQDFWKTIVIMYYFLHVELPFIPSGKTGQQIIAQM